MSVIHLGKWKLYTWVVPDVPCLILMKWRQKKKWILFFYIFQKLTPTQLLNVWPLHVKGAPRGWHFANRHNSCAEESFFKHINFITTPPDFHLCVWFVRVKLSMYKIYLSEGNVNKDKRKAKILVEYYGCILWSEVGSSLCV